MWTVCDVSAVQPHLYFGLFGWGHAGYNDGLLLFIVRYCVGLCTFLCIQVVKYFTIYCTECWANFTWVHNSD